MTVPIFMEASNDKYELPLCVADTIEELAQMRQVSVSAIHKCLQRHDFQKEHGKFICVRVKAQKLKGEPKWQ